jgi:hypothetical protein
MSETRVSHCRDCYNYQRSCALSNDCPGIACPTCAEKDAEIARLSVKCAENAVALRRYYEEERRLRAALALADEMAAIATIESKTHRLFAAVRRYQAAWEGK